MIAAMTILFAFYGGTAFGLAFERGDWSLWVQAAIALAVAAAVVIVPEDS